jgi:uncharacterized membrane protein
MAAERKDGWGASMGTMRRVLIAGESWTVHSTHQKGFDSFSTVEYSEGIHWLRAALEAGGWQVEYQPSHVAARNFPFDAQALSQFDCVLLSDIGANTLLLHPDTFVRSVALPNRLHAIRDYVAGGGGFVMIGGYLTFQGIDAKGQYSGTAIEEILPVGISRTDDRVECPQGVIAKVIDMKHPIVAGLNTVWPHMLGFNRVTPKEGASVIAAFDEAPLIVAGQYKKGRSVAFTSDCAPHWAPTSFVEWAGYAPLWQQIVGWASGENNRA